MPTKKKATKKKPAKKSTGKPKMDDVMMVGEELVSQLKKAKSKFDKMDEDTKKKIIMGIVGFAAVLATKHKVKKVVKKHKKKAKAKKRK